MNSIPISVPVFENEKYIDTLNVGVEVDRGVLVCFVKDKSKARHLENVSRAFIRIVESDNKIVDTIVVQNRGVESIEIPLPWFSYDEKLVEDLKLTWNNCYFQQTMKVYPKGYVPNKEGPLSEFAWIDFPDENVVTIPAKTLVTSVQFGFDFVWYKIEERKWILCLDNLILSIRYKDVDYYWDISARLIN